MSSHRFIPPRLRLLLATLTLLTLPRGALPACTEGTVAECAEAEFAPGTDLAGEGFDITRMERKGAFVINMNVWKRRDRRCVLCTNPYLEQRRQKLPLAVVDWRPQRACSSKVSSRLHRSSESLVASSSSSVENNWQANLEMEGGRHSGSLMLAGTHSKMAEYSMEKSKSDRFSFTSLGMTCSYYSYRVTSSPQLHREFRSALRRLPSKYSSDTKQAYYKLIDTYGTHYITKVKLGGSVQSVTSIRQCQASLAGVSVDEVQMCLQVEASASAKVSASAEAKHCKKDVEKTESKSSFSDLFNDRFTEIRGGQTNDPDLLFSAVKNPSAYQDWLNTLPQHPDLVSYSLDSLHELLPAKSPVRRHLQGAISHYILERGLWRNCSERCSAGVHSQRRDPCVCECHNQQAVGKDCCPTRKGLARVILRVQRATELWGDHTSATDGYVKVAFNNVQVGRTQVINNNNHPQWAMVLDLGTQDLTRGTKVHFEVWDQDSGWDDDLLGSCDRTLAAGSGQDVCGLQHGRLYFSWEVACAPSLKGNTCTTYQPTPMSPSLAPLYKSRHATAVPQVELLRMGVFLGGPAASGRNRSQSQAEEEEVCPLRRL